MLNVISPSISKNELWYLIKIDGSPGYREVRESLNTAEEAGRAGAELLSCLPDYLHRIKKAVTTNVIAKTLLYAWEKGYKIDSTNFYETFHPWTATKPSQRMHRERIAHELGRYALCVLKDYPMASALKDEKYSVVRHKEITGGRSRTLYRVPLAYAVKVKYFHWDEYEIYKDVPTETESE